MRAERTSQRGTPGGRNHRHTSAAAVRLVPGISAVVAMAMLLAGGPVRAQSGLTSLGMINARIIHKAGIALTFESNAGGVTLGGTGTSAATLDFGTIARVGLLLTGVTRTFTGTDFTVGTPFDVRVDLSGGGTASFNLSASLSANPGVYGYTWDTFALSTTAATVVTNDPNYNVNRTHTLYLTVPFTAAPGAVGNTINVTATAN